MDVKKVALLVGALVIAVITAVMAKNMFTGAGAPQASAAPAVPMGPKVLVARKAFPVGTHHRRRKPSLPGMAEGARPGRLLHRRPPDGDPAKLIGTVVRNPITAGQPITQGSLVGPNDRGFLAAALGPGMRAVTVPVSATSGVAGFVFPGDRVDLVLTQAVAGGGEGPPLRVSETIVRNLRVLATDQRIDSKNAEGKTEVKTFAIGDLRGHAAHRREDRGRPVAGHAQLSLRSIADNTAELERAVAAGEVKVPEGTNPADERRMLLAIANRPIDTNTTYTTGGDVSRFQRSSRPGVPVRRRGRQRHQLATAMMRASPRRLGRRSVADRVRRFASRAAILSPSFPGSSLR